MSLKRRSGPGAASSPSDSSPFLSQKLMEIFTNWVFLCTSFSIFHGVKLDMSHDITHIYQNVPQEGSWVISLIFLFFIPVLHIPVMRNSNAPLLWDFQTFWPRHCRGLYIFIRFKAVSFLCVQRFQLNMKESGWIRGFLCMSGVFQVQLLMCSSFSSSWCCSLATALVSIFILWHLDRLAVTADVTVMLFAALRPTEEF